MRWGVLLIALCISLNLQAQIGSSSDNTQRSIWDKDPEPKSTDGSPFGSPATAQQRLGTGINQQGTATLGSPNTGTLQGGASGPDAGGVPIDGGLSLLLAAGAGLGVKKLRDARRNRKK